MDPTFQATMLNYITTQSDFLCDPASDNDLNLFQEKSDSIEIASLKKEAQFIILDSFGEICFNQIKDQRAWYCGSGMNHYLNYHNHAGSALSMIFYFHVQNGGDLVFHDPRMNANRGYSPDYREALQLKDLRWSPNSGDVVLFPSFLFHSVLPSRGMSNRIAIAIDFFFTPA